MNKDEELSQWIISITKEKFGWSWQAINYDQFRTGYALTRKRAAKRAEKVANHVDVPNVYRYDYSGSVVGRYSGLFGQTHGQVPVPNPPVPRASAPTPPPPPKKHG